MALPFTLKSILRQKKNYGNSNYGNKKYWNPPLEIKMLQAIIKESLEYIIFKNI
jgi:hypothetical protein